jgi:hypothetical protein
MASQRALDSFDDRAEVFQVSPTPPDNPIAGVLQPLLPHLLRNQSDWFVVFQQPIRLTNQPLFVPEEIGPSNEKSGRIAYVPL